jgi:glycosyltransferase involved in cell wall biosynthesis
MYKIVFLITGLRLGGAETMLFNLLRRLDYNRFQTTVISLADEGDLGKRFRDLPISLYVIGMKQGRLGFPLIIKAFTLVRRLKPDLLLGWMYHGNLAAQISSLFCHDRPPVIWNIRQSIYSLKRERLLTAGVIRICSWLSRFPKGIVYNSKKSAEQHEAMGYKPNKRVLIPNGFDTDIFKPSIEEYRSIRKELGLPEGSVIIGLIGRHHPLKGHKHFIQAAAMLKDKFPAIRFILAGSQVHCKNMMIWRQVIDLNLAAQMHLLGMRSDMPRITAALDISSSSSLAEGFSNAIGEAMACGVPCVVTDVGDSAWIVGDTGRVVPARNAEALAKGLADLIQMGTDRRRSLGQQARQRVIDHFSLDTVVRRYEQLYLEVLGKDNEP